MWSSRLSIGLPMKKAGIRAIDTRKVSTAGDLDIKSLASELCVERIIAISIENASQSTIDRVIRSLIREGLSIFAADNHRDTVRLYITRRTRAGCPE
jgi:hypothetical protein